MELWISVGNPQMDHKEKLKCWNKTSKSRLKGENLLAKSAEEIGDEVARVDSGFKTKAFESIFPFPLSFLLAMVALQNSGIIENHDLNYQNLFKSIQKSVWMQCFQTIKRIS
jgi:hypothetical protein